MLKKKMFFNYKIKIKTTATGLMSLIILQCQGVIPI